MSLQRNRQPSLPLGYTVEGNKLVALSGIDFVRHKHIIGVSGSGKSSFLASCIMFLLRQAVPFILLDPHGDLAKLIVSLLASSDFFNNPRAYDRLWYIDFARPDAGVAFNVLKQPYEPHTTANNLLEATHRAFPMSGTTTASLDNMILAGTLALVENGLPLTALNTLILDSSFREAMLRNVTDPLVVQFFKSKFSDKVNSSLVDSTLRRSFLLTFSPSLRNTLGQRENKLNFRYILDNNISCIFNLGGLDDMTKRFVGCLLMVGIEQAFLSRANIPDAKRTPMHVFVDEFPLFSASEDSFSVVLEQVRKYKGTLYLAHQTTSQLSRGMTGSLQNAISILFKLGYEDSTWAAGRFVRKPQQEPGLLDSLLGNTSQPGAFDSVENLQDAKQVFENLERSEAIVTISKQALHIRTLTIPQVRVDPRKLAEIEDMYASKLLTPLPNIQKEQSASSLVLVSPMTSPLAKRRVASAPIVEGKPLQFITGTLSDDLLTSLFHLHYATLSQLCKLLGRESSSNHVRDKLNNLKDNGMVDSTTLARSTSGKPPTVWYLTKSTRKDIADSLGLPVPLATGEKKHGYLEHTLACNEPLIASALLPQVEPSFTLIDLKHERTLKNTAIKISEGVYLVPDAWIHLKLHQEHIGICFELDRNTEEKEKIQQKIQSYVSFASGIYQQTFGLESLTIAFCVTEGGDRRVKQLGSWAEQVLEDNKDAASLFLFGSISPGALEPDVLFLNTRFLLPFDNTPHTLVEM